YEELTRTGGVEARAAIVRQMNDLLIEGGALIPLVFRGSVSAHSNSLGGVDMNGWDSEMWNVQDWYRADM
ncbi:MAG: peptide ABC transporter substrate-binding protein, partial [Chloroflexota bacterium]|nr:peptide ABC transporter substrate-binding protein [Chloroflexota bacterium]